jgi:glycosyltransferase involved in cell wall biosynthesis
VLAQITSDVEVIVNNDSMDILEINHPQVTYYYNKTDTLCGVYQLLLSAAQGEYVYFLEDDDYLVEGFFDQVLDADLIAGNYCPRYETPNMLTFMTLYKDAWLTPKEFMDSVNIEHLQLSQHIYKRSVICDFNFPNDGDIHNDIKLTMHAASKASSIKTLSKVLYYQTIDGGDNISFPKNEIL